MELLMSTMLNRTEDNADSGRAQNEGSWCGDADTYPADTGVRVKVTLVIGQIIIHSKA